MIYISLDSTAPTFYFNCKQLAAVQYQKVDLRISVVGLNYNVAFHSAVGKEMFHFIGKFVFAVAAVLLLR